MRIDKFLKVSRLIKRRTVANDACDAGRISVNGKTVKPSHDVKVGDIITVGFGTKKVSAKILSLQPVANKADCAEMFEIIDNN